MERHYFLTTIGCQGRASFLEGTLCRYRNLIRVSGYPRSLTGRLIHECYTLAKQGNLRMEFVHNCLDNSPEGIFFPDLGSAFINEPIYEPRYDIASLYDTEGLADCKKQMEKAEKCFLDAKKIHDDWEKIYISQTDFNALNRLSDEVTVSLLDGQKTDYRGQFCDRFFGAATINGSVDYIDNLSYGMRRYFIKGRPGTGKSTFMKKFASAACDSGFHVDRYHCAFDPGSLDMVIVRELKLCIFDSTAPHEYFPSRQDDRIIDFYTAAVLPDTDRQFEKDILHCKTQYKDAINSATRHLIAANEIARGIEDKVLKKCDEDKIMNMRNHIIHKLFP